MLPKSLLATITVSLTTLTLLETVVAQGDPVDIILGASTGIAQCYSFDGFGNNRQNPSWGAVGETFLRPEGRE